MKKLHLNKDNLLLLDGGRSGVGRPAPSWNFKIKLFSSFKKKKNSYQKYFYISFFFNKNIRTAAFWNI